MTHEHRILAANVAVTMSDISKIFMRPQRFCNFGVWGLMDLKQLYTFLGYITLISGKVPILSSWNVSSSIHFGVILVLF